MRALLQIELNPVLTENLNQKATISLKKDKRNNPKRRSRLKESHPDSRLADRDACGKRKLPSEMRRARLKGKQACTTALRNNGLLNPHLLDSDSAEKTEQYFPEKREALPQTGYIDPRVRLDLGKETQHHFTISAKEKAEENQHWQDYLSELSDFDDSSDGIASTLELSDFADYSEKDDFSCGRRIETPSYEEDWEDRLADGYDPADNELSFELHCDKMGTSGSSRHRAMTIEGQKIMAMPIITRKPSVSKHFPGNTFEKRQREVMGWDNRW